MDRRIWLFTAIAFVAGGLVGAALVAPASPFALFAPKTLVLVHIENAGDAELAARLDVRDTGGKLLTSTTFRVAAHAVVEKSVVHLAPGAYDVRGTFTNDGAVTSGIARADTTRCPEGTVALATFSLTSGAGSIGMAAQPSAGCRS